MLSKIASELGPITLKKRNLSITGCFFNLIIPVNMDNKKIGEVFGDLNIQTNELWLQFGDESEAIGRIKKRNPDSNFSIEYKNKIYPIKDIFKSKDDNYYLKVTLMQIKTAAIKPITYHTTKDLTDLIWGDRCASDLSDADLIRMTIGQWDYIFNDVFRNPKIETTWNVDKEVVTRLLTQNLYEAGLKDQERIQLIVGFAVKEIFTPKPVTSENKNLKD